MTATPRSVEFRVEIGSLPRRDRFDRSLCQYTCRPLGAAVRDRCQIDVADRWNQPLRYRWGAHTRSARSPHRRFIHLEPEYDRSQLRGNRSAELTSMITHQIARQGDAGPANAYAFLAVQLLHDVHGRMIRRDLAAEHRLLGWNNNMFTAIIGKSYDRTVIHHAKNGHDTGHLPHCRLVLRKDNAHRLPDQRSIKFAPLNLSLAHECSLALGSPRNTVRRRQLLAISPASPDGRTPPSSSARRPIWINAAGSSPDHSAASGGSRRRRDINP